MVQKITIDGKEVSYKDSLTVGEMRELRKKMLDTAKQYGDESDEVSTAFQDEALRLCVVSLDGTEDKKEIHEKILALPFSEYMRLWEVLQVVVVPLVPTSPTSTGARVQE